MCFKVPGQSWFCVSVFFCFFSPFCADASCQAEIIDFWGDIKSWKSLAGPFGGQRLNSPSSPLWQICISGVGDTLSAVFFSPFLFSFKAFSGNCEKSLATAHAHVCVWQRQKWKMFPFVDFIFFFRTSFSVAASLMLLQWAPFLTVTLIPVLPLKRFLVTGLRFTVLFTWWNWHFLSPGASKFSKFSCECTHDILKDTWLDTVRVFLPPVRLF